MKLHIVKTNGDSVVIDDVKIIHAGNFCSIAERSDNVQFWSDPIQHDKVKQCTEIVFPK